MASKLFKFSGNTNGHCQLCNDADEKDKMIGCDDCQHWFHKSCANVPKDPPKKQEWFCPRCVTIAEKLRGSVNPIIEMMEAQKEAFRYMSNKSTNNQVATLKEMMDAFKASLNVKNEQLENQSAMVVDNPSGEAAILQLNKIVTRQALMDLPDFDGSYKVWPRFQSIFETTTKEGGFSDVENLNRLEKHLKGQALFHVESLLTDHTNVPLIMKSLKEQCCRRNSVGGGIM